MGVAAVDISSPAKRARHGVDHPRVNQRFVALDVDHGVAGAIGGDLGDAVGAAGDGPGAVISARQKSCATSQMRVSSVATMTSSRLLALWQRSTTCWMRGFAGDEGERFSGKTALNRSGPG